MLSLAGETAGLAGVGEGSGWAASTTADIGKDRAVVFAEAPIANAKPLSDRPPTHASANALMAIFLKCLGIISLLRDCLLNSAARSLEMPGKPTFKARAALRGSSTCCQK